MVKSVPVVEGSPSTPDAREFEALRGDRGRILRAVLWLSGAMMLFHGLVLLLMVQTKPAVVSFAIAALCLLMGRIAVDRVELVGWTFTAAMQAVAVSLAFFGGGLELGYGLVMAVVAVQAALVLGWEAGVLHCGVAMVASVSAQLVGSTNVLLFPDQELSEVILSVHIFAFAVLAVNLAFAVRHLYATLRASQARRKELNRTVEALRLERESSDRLLRSMAEPVWVTSMDLEIVLANDAATQLLGLPLEEIVGRPLTVWADLPDLADRRVRGEGMLRTVRGSIPVQVSRARVGTDAEPRWVFVASDLSRRMEAEAQIRAAAKVAAEANQAKSHFLANISHELRTPMNAILGYSEMLLEEERTEADRTDLERIHGAGRHLLGLINDILDMSKIEAGAMDLRLENVRVGPLIRQCCDTLQPVARAAGNELSAPASDLVLHTDRQKLSQVLLNLLSNAVKYTSDGVVAVEITTEGDMACLAVRDSGCGIAEHDMPRLFQPFDSWAPAPA